MKFRANSTQDKARPVSSPWLCLLPLHT